MDASVDAFHSAVDAAADYASERVAAAAQGLRDGINAALDAFEAGINAAFELADTLLSMDFSDIVMLVLSTAVRAAGIDPDTFMEYIEKAKDNVRAIIDDPAGFLANLGAAFTGGVELFIGDFAASLRAGIVDWLTDAMSGVDIVIPERFDLMGVLDLARQVMGLTWDYLKEKIAGVIGEENLERLLWVKDQIKLFIDEGWSGLFEQVMDRLSGVRDDLFAQIRDFLVVRILTQVVTRIASLLSPVGAVIQLVLTVWDFIQAALEVLSRIWSVVTSVIDALDKIVNGILDPAKEAVKSTLDRLLPIAIGVLARFLRLGGLAARVQGFIEGLRARVDQAVDALIERVRGFFTGGDEEADGEEGEEDLETSPEDEETHQRFVREAIEAMEAPPAEVIDFQSFREQKRQEADRLKATYDPQLEEPVQMTIRFIEEAEDDQSIRFNVMVAPNNEEGEGETRQPNSGPVDRALRFILHSNFRIRGVEPPRFAHPEDSTYTYDRTSISHFRKDDYISFHTAQTEGEITTSMWRTDIEKQREGITPGTQAFFVGAESTHRYALLEVESPGFTWVQDLEVQEVDLELKEALDFYPRVVDFMLAMARDGKARNLEWQRFSALWSQRPPIHAEYVKNRFRNNVPGHHEWLPSDLIRDVIENSLASIDGNQTPSESELLWIRAHHIMRTPTNHIIFPPTDGNLAGHVGALYKVEGAEMSEDTATIVLKQATEGQKSFHDTLRGFFSGENAVNNPFQFLRVLKREIRDGRLLWNPDDTNNQLLDDVEDAIKLKRLNRVLRVPRQEALQLIETWDDLIGDIQKDFVFVNITVDQLVTRQRAKREELLRNIDEWALQLRGSI